MTRIKHPLLCILLSMGLLFGIYGIAGIQPAHADDYAHSHVKGTLVKTVTNPSPSKTSPIKKVEIYKESGKNYYNLVTTVDLSLYKNNFSSSDFSQANRLLSLTALEWKTGSKTGQLADNFVIDSVLVGQTSWVSYYNADEDEAESYFAPGKTIALTLKEDYIGVPDTSPFSFTLPSNAEEDPSIVWPKIESLSYSKTDYESVEVTFSLDKYYSVPSGDNVYVGFYVDGKYKKAVSGWNSYSQTVDVPITYGKTNLVTLVYLYDKKQSDGTYKTYYKGAGEKEGQINVKGKTIGKNSLAITKLSGGKVRISAIRSYENNYTNVYSTVQVLNGKKWKDIKSKLGGNTNRSAFTYKASSAASKKYRVISYYKDSSGKMHKGATSGTYKAKSNVGNTNNRISDPHSYRYATARFVPYKFYYSGGKLKVTGYVGNTRIFKLKKIKVKVTLYVDNKKIASQTFTTKNVGSYKNKKVTYTFKKAKKEADLRNGSLTYNISISPSW